jgi:hypothetical protein
VDNHPSSPSDANAGTPAQISESSHTASASATVLLWQNFGHEILETILKSAKPIKATFAEVGMDKNKIDAAARTLAESKTNDAVLEGIEYARKRANSAVITGDEMMDILFPTFRRQSSNHKQPKKAKRTSQKVSKKATDKASKKGGLNA